MLKMVFAVLLVGFFAVPALAATSEDEAALDRLVLEISTQEVHKAEAPMGDEKLLAEITAAGVVGVEVSDEEADSIRFSMQPPAEKAPSALSITAERAGRMK